MVAWIYRGDPEYSAPNFIRDESNDPHLRLNLQQVETPHRRCSHEMGVFIQA